MWPFSKATRSINVLPKLADDGGAWGGSQGTYKGAALVVRYNQAAKEWVGHAELPIKLGFAIPFSSPNPQGMPDPEENRQVNDIEDIIIAELDEKARAVQALVLTTSSMKEFVFYIPQGVDIASIHKSVQDRVKSHTVQCMAVMEPKWDSYKQFSAG